MDLSRLPFDAKLSEYEMQAAGLLAAQGAGDGDALKLIMACHPRYRDEKIPWLVKEVEEPVLRAAPFDLDDARIAVARAYDFLDWPSLEAYANSDAQTMRFEAAVEAVINGDLAALRKLLHEDPALPTARSNRVTCFDPPIHRATLLHYLVANGTEGYRQRTPPNAVAIAQTLLEAGADPDALADMYGGQCTVMSMLASSSHPAEAGVQEDLVELLIDFGAAVEKRGEGNWTSPVLTALVFGYTLAAESLVRRGAPVDDVTIAAGLGRLQQTQEMWPVADAEARHRALALAAQSGQVEIVRMMLEAGEAPDRYNPEHFHKHSTPLHQAAFRGDLEMAKLLLQYGAKPDLKDRIYHSNPLGWAIHAGQPEMENLLRTHS